MSDLQIATASTAGDIREFIMLPFRLYEGVDQWVPPLISERKRHLDRRRNPFFQHADAEYFLARRGDRVVGRISAQVDQLFNEFHDNDWGQFGFFECEDDPEVARRARRGRLRAGCASAAATTRSGRSTSPPTTSAGCSSTASSCGRRSSRTGITPTTAALLEGCGLVKAMDLYKWSAARQRPRATVMPIIFEMADKLEPEHGITIRGMRRSDMQGEISRFMEIYNAAWETNWGFVPLTETEIRHYAKELKPILDENWAMVAETRRARRSASR